MILQTYVNFRGRCAEAFRYYEHHLGAKPGAVMTFAEAPPNSGTAPEWRDKVMHAQLELGGTVLMGADVPTAEPMRSAYLSLTLASDAEAERIYAALADGGQVLMALQETFFASRFGQVRDRFGVNWMLLHPRPRPTAA